MKFFYSQAKPDIFRVFGACPIFFERDSDDEEDVWGLRSDTKCRKSLVKEGGQRNDDGALIGASADTKNVRVCVICRGHTPFFIVYNNPISVLIDYI